MENSKKKSRFRIDFVATGVLLIVVAVVCLLISLTNGKTTIVNTYDNAKGRDSVVCESNITTYPLFSYDNSDSKTIKINAVFDSDRLISISLVYKLKYSNQSEIRKSESVNHGALNISLQNEGFNPDAFEAKYSKLEDGLQLSLFASGDEISSKALKYFMLDGLTPSYTQEDFRDIYVSQGFNCEIRK